MNDTLQQILALMDADPHSGDSLLLYALVSTLRMENTGYMYSLRRLRDLSPDGRRLAYALMELMAEGGNRGGAWDEAVAAMDAAIRGD
jgi:hypothetical protein